MVNETAYGDCQKQYKGFWETGTVFRDKGLLKKANLYNPMFGCLRKRLVIHYGSDPVGDFRPAIPQANLTTDSPLNFQNSPSATFFNTTVFTGRARLLVGIVAISNTHHSFLIQKVTSEVKKRRQLLTSLTHPICWTI